MAEPTPNFTDAQGRYFIGGVEVPQAAYDEFVASVTKALERGDQARAEVDRMREFVRAVANDDFESMVAIGGAVEHRGATSRLAEDFELEGSYQSDARYVHPVRRKATKQAAWAVLGYQEATDG